MSINYPFPAPSKKKILYLLMKLYIPLSKYLEKKRIIFNDTSSVAQLRMLVYRPVDLPVHLHVYNHKIQKQYINWIMKWWPWELTSTSPSRCRWRPHTAARVVDPGFLCMPHWRALRTGRCICSWRTVHSSSLSLPGSKGQVCSWGARSVGWH